MSWRSKGLLNPKFIKLLLLVAGLIIAGVIWLHSPGVKQGRAKNLILFSIDTLRADRLGAYGYQRATSPVLDGFAKQAVVFENAIAASSWTLPSHVSMLTALYPSSHGVTLPKGIRIGKNTRLISEHLSSLGFRTFAYVSGGYLGVRYGFNRGFEEYLTDKGKKKLNQFDITNSINFAKEKISSFKKNERYFLFLHSFDVHCPYVCPEPHMSMFSSETAEYIDPANCASPYYNSMKLSQGQAKYLSDRYDGSIHWVDHKLGELFDFLKDRGELENTAVIITSDHGDEFLEHGKIGHKKSLHKQLVHIPLIIYAPGISPTRVTYPVNHVDIAPTALELLGVDTLNAAQGASLVSIMTGEAEPSTILPRFQFSELDMGLRLRSHYDLKGHLIRNIKNENQNKYYDLSSDPEELKNIADSSGDEVRMRSSEIDDLLETLPKHETDVLDKATKEEVERLKSLGYFGGAQ